MTNSLTNAVQRALKGSERPSAPVARPSLEQRLRWALQAAEHELGHWHHEAKQHAHRYPQGAALRHYEYALARVNTLRRLADQPVVPYDNRCAVVTQRWSRIVRGD